MDTRTHSFMYTYTQTLTNALACVHVCMCACVRTDYHLCKIIFIFTNSYAFASELRNHTPGEDKQFRIRGGICR